jgi:hypothetical protein
MQDLDPSRRPGAGPDGYAILKIHPFFKGVDWNNLRAQTPPKLALEPGVRHPSLCSSKYYLSKIRRENFVSCPFSWFNKTVPNS